ncbi:MAG: PIG-L family deacetylase, partial [Methylococcales bacterium]|nr:PIG-L family deacetylase [Methylococcales bacterium]
MTLAIESTYLPSSPSPLADGSWLVLAPHPDDETFGMGGTLLLAQKAHIKVDVLFLTDGSASDAIHSDLVKIREQEAIKACKKLGINEVIFWREIDRKLMPSTHLIQKLSAFITERNYASVFFPSPQEPHPDHRITAVLAWESLRNIQFSASPISYDISV